MYTCGWSMLMDGRNQRNIVKQLSFSVTSINLIFKKLLWESPRVLFRSYGLPAAIATFVRVYHETLLFVRCEITTPTRGVSVPVTFILVDTVKHFPHRILKGNGGHKTAMLISSCLTAGWKKTRLEIWTRLETFTQSEVSPKEKNKYPIWTRICGLWKNTGIDDHIGQVEIDMQT